MARVAAVARPISTDTLYFGGIALIVFTIYQLLYIFIAITQNGECLYSFWMPYKSQLFSPFWLVVGIVSLLLVRTAANVWVHIVGRATSWKIEVGLHILAIICFSIWLYSMFEFSIAMDYERGLIAPEEFFDKRILEWYVPDEGFHVCKSAT